MRHLLHWKAAGGIRGTKYSLADVQRHSISCINYDRFRNNSPLNSNSSDRERKIARLNNAIRSTLDSDTRCWFVFDWQYDLALHARCHRGHETNVPRRKRFAWLIVIECYRAKTRVPTSTVYLLGSIEEQRVIRQEKFHRHAGALAQAIWPCCNEWKPQLATRSEKSKNDNDIAHKYAALWWKSSRWCK